MFFLTLKYKEINLQSNLATRKMRKKGGDNSSNPKNGTFK